MPLTSIDVITTLAPLRAVLDDVWETEEQPDYGGSRWLDLYRGTGLDELFVMSDCAGNALHVVRDGRERLTITYVPGWLFELATHAIDLLGAATPSLLRPEDLDRAQPLRIEAAVVHELSYDGTGHEDEGYRRLQFGYDFAPSCAVEHDLAAPAAAISTPVPAEEAKPGRIFWTPPSLRLAAAPGVSVRVTPVFSASTLSDLRGAYLQSAPPGEPDALQTLRFELERRQDPFALPALGAPARATPLPEGGLAAQSSPLADGRPLILEQPRPDGADIILIRSYDDAMADVGWLRWVAEQALALPGALIRGQVNEAIRWMGGLPDDVPLVIRLRFDPASAEDRFAYRIDYLDDAGDPVPRTRAGDTDGKALFRLTVVRTAEVTVINDMKLDDWGRAAVDQVLEYRERKASFDAVPFTVESHDGTVTSIPDVEADAWYMLRVAHDIGSFVPLPQLQMFYDLEDVGSLGTYLLFGKNVFWEDMTRLDAGITLAGLILPELAERGVKRLFGRLHVPGGDPTARIRSADAALLDEDRMLAEGLAPRFEESTP
jgi:hypothetical protein